MNNRFKFRVWDKKLNKFTLGYDNDDGSFEEIYSDPPGIFFAGLRYLNKYSDSYIIQQYTGLTDKNNNPIFEGDIVNTIYTNDAGLNIGEVIYHTETCAFRIKTVKQLLPIVTLRFVDDQPQGFLQVADEIVGNIFENPELIK